MKNIEQLLNGYHRFYTKYFDENKSKEDKNRLYKSLHKEGQNPKTLIVACSDSRVDPAIIFDTNPGDIFVVRNVANLVPPYQPKGGSIGDFHGISSALEFGICCLNIPNIIVFGHSSCAGIRELINSNYTKQEGNNSFLKQWINIANPAKEKIEKKGKDRAAHLYEKEAICISLQNLMTFPWIKEKVEQQKLCIYGWYFSIETGKISLYNKEKDCFENS